MHAKHSIAMCRNRRLLIVAYTRFRKSLSRCEKKILFYAISLRISMRGVVRYYSSQLVFKSRMYFEYTLITELIVI